MEDYILSQDTAAQTKQLRFFQRLSDIPLNGVHLALSH